MAAEHGRLAGPYALADDAANIRFAVFERVLADEVGLLDRDTRGGSQRRHGRDTSRCRARDYAQRAPRRDRVDQARRLLHAASGQRTTRVRQGIGARRRLAMPQRDQRERTGHPGVDQSGERLENGDVGRVAQIGTRLLDGDPFDGGDLAVGYESGVRDGIGRNLGSPIVHDLGAAVWHVVVRHAERHAEGHGQPGLFLYFAHRGVGQRFARVHLALGNGHVAVYRAVNQQHLHTTLDQPPADGAGGVNSGVVSLDGH